jgi:hypothetical protein
MIKKRILTVRDLVEQAFIALDMQLNSSEDSSLIMMAGSMAIARDKLADALVTYQLEDKEAKTLNPVYAYPQGLRGQEEILSAVMEAGRALFGYGLSPEDTKEAIILLRDYLQNLIDRTGGHPDD